MSEDLNNEVPENMEGEEIDNIVILNDEEGNEVQFEFLDLIEYDGEEYVILLPVEEEVSEEPGEVVILKLENTSDEEESYVSVDDEEILNNVFEIFKEKFKDEHFQEDCFHLLEMMISNSSFYFEKLPLIENVELLRNIIYSGIWTKFELIKKKRMEEKS